MNDASNDLDSVSIPYDFYYKGDLNGLKNEVKREVKNARNFKKDFEREKSRIENQIDSVLNKLNAIENMNMKTYDCYNVANYSKDVVFNNTDEIKMDNTNNLNNIVDNEDVAIDKNIDELVSALEKSLANDVKSNFTQQSLEMNEETRIIEEEQSFNNSSVLTEFKVSNLNEYEVDNNDVKVGNINYNEFNPISDIEFKKQYYTNNVQNNSPEIIQRNVTVDNSLNGFNSSNIEVLDIDSSNVSFSNDTANFNSENVNTNLNNDFSLNLNDTAKIHVSKNNTNFYVSDMPSINGKEVNVENSGVSLNQSNVVFEHDGAPIINDN